MLETIIILLILLWAVGMLASYTLGGIIHILLLVALITLIFRIFRGRPVV